MIDGTVCDIYLVDDAGRLVGRPLLVTYVDAYSGMCLGYSLKWEGGVYALRNLMLRESTSIQACLYRFIKLLSCETKISLLSTTVLEAKSFSLRNFCIENLPREILRRFS